MSVNHNLKSFILKKRFDNEFKPFLDNAAIASKCDLIDSPNENFVYAMGPIGDNLPQTRHIYIGHTYISGLIYNQCSDFPSSWARQRLFLITCQDFFSHINREPANLSSGFSPGVHH